jgi:hypothetical protein
MGRYTPLIPQRQWHDLCDTAKTRPLLSIFMFSFIQRLRGSSSTAPPPISTSSSREDKKKLPRSLHLERDEIFNDIKIYIQNILPRPTIDGLLKRSDEIITPTACLFTKKRVTYTRKLYDEKHLDSFVDLPIIKAPRELFADLYFSKTSDPETSLSYVETIYLNANNYFVCIPEISSRDFMYSVEKYKKGDGVLACCPKCNSNKNVKPGTFRQYTFKLYTMCEVLNVIVLNYKCTNTNCMCRGDSMISLRVPYSFTSEDIMHNYPNISFLKRAKYSVSHFLASKCFTCDGPTSLVKDIADTYNVSSQNRRLQLLKFIRKKQRYARNKLLLKKEMSTGQDLFTADVAKKVFNECINYYGDNIRSFFLETPVTHSLHGDGTYKMTLATNGSKCLLYILTNSYRQILGYFVMPTEKTENLRPAVVWIREKSSVKIEAVFMDDSRFFKMLREELGEGVATLLDIFHVMQRISQYLRGNDIDASDVRRRLHEVIYGNFPEFEICKKVCESASSEYQISEKYDNVTGDVAQVMFSCVRQGLASDYSAAYYNFARNSNYSKYIRQKPIEKEKMVANMQVFIRWLETTYLEMKNVTNISRKVISQAKLQLVYMQKGYCSPPADWTNDKLFYKINKPGTKNKLQRWGKVFGTSGVESINRSISAMANGIGNMTDETNGNRITVNLYRQERRRRKLLGQTVSPDAYEFPFLHDNANKINKAIYGTNLFEVATQNGAKDSPIKFGYAYNNTIFQNQLLHILAKKNVDPSPVIESTNVKSIKNNGQKKKRAFNVANTGNSKRQKIKTMDNTHVGAHSQQVLTADERRLIYNSIAAAKGKVLTGDIKHGEVASVAYMLCLQEYLINQDRHGDDKKKKIRAPIHVTAISRILNEKLVGQSEVRTKKEWPIDVDSIKLLSKRGAMEYVKELQLSNVYTKERKLRFNGSRQACAIDALIKERNSFGQS